MALSPFLPDAALIVSELELKSATPLNANCLKQHS